MSDIIRTNYCAHAIDSLTEQARIMRKSGIPQIAIVYESVAKALADSVKYLLPEQGAMIAPEELDETHFGLLALSSPCVALESYWGQNDGLPTRAGVQVSHAAKRIALCWDPDKYEGPIRGAKECSDRYEGGGICVLPIYQTVATPEWVIAHGVEFVPYDTPLTRNLKPDTNASKIAASFLEKEGHGGGKWAKKIDCFPTIPEILPQLLQHYHSIDAIKASIMMENWDEVYMLVQACAVLQCENVQCELDIPAQALNKSRIAKGQTPFFEYHIMAIDGERGKEWKRMHLKKGQLVPLDGRVTWARPSLVQKPSWNTPSVVPKGD